MNAPPRKCEWCAEPPLDGNCEECGRMSDQPPIDDKGPRKVDV